MTRLTLNLLLAAALLHCAGTAKAQTLAEFAISIPAPVERHLAVGQSEVARVGIVNLCERPVDIEVRVTPYAPEGFTNPDYNPQTISRTLSAKGFAFVEPALFPTVDNVAHADIEIGPASSTDPPNSCFAPGQNLILTSIGIFSEADNSLIRVIPIHFKGPSVSSSTNLKPLGDRVLVEPIGSKETSLFPIDPGDILQLVVENPCPTPLEADGAILVVNAADGPMPLDIDLDIDLDPGERKVLSLKPIDAGEGAIAGGYWLILPPLSPLSRGEHTVEHTVACSDAIKVAFIYKPA